jgi:LPS-assembly lipoprotein
MSSSSTEAMGGWRGLRALMLAVALMLPVAACSGLHPLYGDSGLTRGSIEIAYAKPANRLEQIIYQDLALRLGKSRGGDAPELEVTASQSSRALAAGNIVSPNRQRQMTVSATITLTSADGKVLFSGRRSAAADYTTNSQVLANQAAETEAAERAAKALADTIRLSLLAALASPAQ